MRQKIAAGNWKMNGTADALSELEAIRDGLPASAPQVVICPPSPLLFRASAMAGAVAVGAQDCHTAASGAHTGDISASMIADTGTRYVIVGHSERRASYSETSQDVRAKAEAAFSADLTAIICIGETLEEREAGDTLNVIADQLAGSIPDGTTAQNTVVAYEPVWAIGTGKIPTQEQIVEVHDFIRAELKTRFGNAIADALPLLYGGSVKASNAAMIFEAENVDGALVGGASLEAADFLPIIEALAES